MGCKKWGGINSKTTKNPLNKLIENIEFQNYKFERIASWSKINSFKNIKTDIIYNSRVIYSLNYLIFKSNGNNFFPQPSGRNPQLNKYPIKNILKKFFQNQNFIKETKKLTKNIENLFIKYTHYFLQTKQ
jgi:hypothetical protein